MDDRENSPSSIWKANPPNDCEPVMMQHPSQRDDDGTILSAMTDDKTSCRLEEIHRAYRFEKSLPLCGRVEERNQMLTAFAKIAGLKGRETQAVVM